MYNGTTLRVRGPVRTSAALRSAAFVTRGPGSRATLYRMYAGVPYPNADDKALSMAASSVTTSGVAKPLPHFLGIESLQACDALLQPLDPADQRAVMARTISGGA
jgi:hypothetical protein